MEDKKIFKLNINHEPDGRYRSLFFNAKVDGETISVADLNDERNNKTYESYDRGLKGEKKIFDAHKGFISYEVEISAMCGKKYFDSVGYCVDIGKRNSITRDQLINLIKKDIKENDDPIERDYQLDKLKKINWDTAKYSFRSMYDYAYYDFNDNRLDISELTEKAMNIVKDKSVLEKVIKAFDNKNLSTKEFLKVFAEAYSWDNAKIVEKIIQNRFKNPQSFEIKTELAGPSSLWTEGHGRDFSYQFTPTKKHLTIYAEEGTKIDTEKVYSQQEVKDMLKDKSLILVYEYGLYCGEIKDNTSNITQKEIDKTIRDSITKEMLLNDYKEFINFYKLNKIEIGLNIKQIKTEHDEKIKKYNDEKAEGDKTIKILESYDYESL